MEKETFKEIFKSVINTSDGPQEIKSYDKIEEITKVTVSNKGMTEDEIKEFKRDVESYMSTNSRGILLRCWFELIAAYPDAEDATKVFGKEFLQELKTSFKDEYLIDYENKIVYKVYKTFEEMFKRR